jgi:hypothetical protein
MVDGKLIILLIVNDDSEKAKKETINTINKFILHT